MQQYVLNPSDYRNVGESLNAYSGSKLEENFFVFDYRDEVLDVVGQACDIDFSLKYRTLGEIKKLLANTKISEYGN